MTPEFYNKFTANDDRKIFWENGQTVDVTDMGEFTNGIGFQKYKNVTSAGNPGKADGFPDTDFPVFRYADVLLMAAECAVRGASIDGLSAFNQVRERAGMPAVNALNLNEIIDERGRELYQECWRRNDLIRFGLFTGSDYVWQWKGGVQGGTGVDSYRALFPIPDSDRLANNKLSQNQGY